MALPLLSFSGAQTAPRRPSSSKVGSGTFQRAERRDKEETLRTSSTQPLHSFPFTVGLSCDCSCKERVSCPESCKKHCCTGPAAHLRNLREHWTLEGSLCPFGDCRTLGSRVREGLSHAHVTRMRPRIHGLQGCLSVVAAQEHVCLHRY